MPLLACLATHLEIHSWRNCIEIVFFALLFYGFCCWLKTERGPNLLLPFHLYWGIAIIAYVLELTTIALFLLYFAPPALCLFAIVHQHSLQRAFVTAKNLTTTCNKLSTNTWLQTLIQSCLYALAQEREITAVIERTHLLENYLRSERILQAPLFSTTLQMIIDSPLFDNQYLLWLRSDGSIQAMNSHWSYPEETVFAEADVSALPPWQQEAVIMTSKTDAIVVHVDVQSRAFWICAQGNYVEYLRAPEALGLLQEMLQSDNPNHRGENHASRRTPFGKQLHS